MQHLLKWEGWVPRVPPHHGGDLVMQRLRVRCSPAGCCASFPLGSVVLLVAFLQRELRHCVPPLVFAFGSGLHSIRSTQGREQALLFSCGTVHGVVQQSCPCSGFLQTGFGVGSEVSMAHGSRITASLPLEVV